MRRWTSLQVLASSALGVMVAMPAAPGAQTAAAVAATYHETIPGTLVEFEMVRIDDFYLGRTEVTWDMYDVFALGLDEADERAGADAVARPSNPYGAPDYGWGHAGFPVMSVTRHAAEAFCDWLSKTTGRTYRLPTDAEWTRAAALAAGEQPLSDDRVAELAWYRPNAERRTHAVATRQADALGLFDLFGNTAEWVTTATGDLVTRGGSFRDADVGPDARATQDFSWNETDPQIPKSRWWLSDGPFVGFRLAADPEG